jgi:hypothetical protein
MVQLVHLGFFCNTFEIVRRQLGIQGPTGLFEYFTTENLSIITDVISTIKSGIDSSIVNGDNERVTVLNNNMRSHHYSVDDFKERFKRRAARFLDLVKSDEECIFFRIEILRSECSKATKEEVERFYQVIRSINPTRRIRFLLVGVQDQGVPIIVDEPYTEFQFHHRFFKASECNGDSYMRDNPKLCADFRSYLDEISPLETNTV